MLTSKLPVREQPAAPERVAPPRVNHSLKRQQLSRSKLELFHECPRCFYDELVHNRRRPASPPFTLNNAVDALLKSEFDLYRASGTPHPIFASVGLAAVPLTHPQINEWRTNRTGVRWKDPETGWTLYGAVDDVWETPSKTVIVADYKATAKRDEVSESNLYPGYKRQIEVYQFLLAQQGLTVEPRAWFVYANGIPTRGSFDNHLTFRTMLLPYDGDCSWVLGKFREAVALVTGAVRPSPADPCQWCRYTESAIHRHDREVR